MESATVDHITRGEFELLRQIVQANATRLDTIDSTGTRGVGIVQAQLTDLVKDVVELKADMNTRFTDHSRLHARERKERVSSRRWFIGTAIAMMAALAGIYSLLYTIINAR